MRILSSAAVKDGDSKLAARYVRQQRQSVMELQQHFLAKAQQIFARQESLLGSAAGDADLDDEDEPDDESQAAAPAAADGAIGKPAAAGKKVAKGLKAGAAAAKAASKPPAAENGDEERDLADMRKAGLLSGSGAAVALAQEPRLEAEPGARRIRRTIITTDAEGVQTSREIIYTDKDKVALLNAMFGNGNSGFRLRHIKGGSRGAQWILQGQAGALGPPSASKGKKGGGARKASIQCKACGGTGHNSKNKICPMYNATHQAAPQDEDFDDEDDFQQTPAKLRPSLTLRIGSSMLLSQGSQQPASIDDADMAETIEPASVSKPATVSFCTPLSKVYVPQAPFQLHPARTHVVACSLELVETSLCCQHLTWAAM